ncbi:HlyD family secretion protein [Reyranella sp.]|uniref:HlyD family secretion protein n=1 Tax=Reyranella sp. TaxID=1929291 RepID=UPI003D0AEE3C
MPPNSSVTVVPLLRLPPLEPRPADAAKPEAPEPRQRRRLVSRRAILAGIGALALLSAIAAGGLYFDYSRRFVSTDDAFIAARQFAVAPKVPGYITAVPVTDNQHVVAGDVIARIDDRDYRVALAQTEAQVAAADAGVSNIAAQIEVAQAQVTASEAQVRQAEARLVYARQQAERYGTLTKEGWSSRQTGDLTVAELAQQQAALGSAQANVMVARRQLDALEAQRSSAIASLREAQDQRDQARLNLSYTTVTAAQPGRIVQLGAAVGQFAQAGTSLTMFVPDEIWVTANFKETQLDALRPGQPVRFEIDAYPERTIRGRVASVQPGSGTAFSLLPAENATGNYVKIVQRVPVKIVIDNAPTDVALGPGMSVLPTVRTDAKPSLIERLGEWL